MAYAEIIRALQSAEQRRENYAREGGDLLRQRTSGTGQLVAAEVHVFGNPFVAKPDVAYGSEIIRLPDLDLYLLPRCTGSVMRWERNQRGFYVGAYVYLDVQCDVAPGASPTVVASPVVEHYFQFRGPSYKELGSAVHAEVQDSRIAPLATEY